MTSWLLKHASAPFLLTAEKNTSSKVTSLHLKEVCSSPGIITRIKSHTVIKPWKWQASRKADGPLCQSRKWLSNLVCSMYLHYKQYVFARLAILFPKSSNWCNNRKEHTIQLDNLLQIRCCKSLEDKSLSFTQMLYCSSGC